MARRRHVGPAPRAITHVERKSVPRRHTAISSKMKIGLCSHKCIDNKRERHKIQKDSIDGQGTTRGFFGVEKEWLGGVVLVAGGSPGRPRPPCQLPLFIAGKAPKGPAVEAKERPARSQVAGRAAARKAEDAAGGLLSGGGRVYPCQSILPLSEGESQGPMAPAFTLSAPWKTMRTGLLFRYTAPAGRSGFPHAAPHPG